MTEQEARHIEREAFIRGLKADVEMIAGPEEWTVTVADPCGLNYAIFKPEGWTAYLERHPHSVEEVTG